MSKETEAGTGSHKNPRRGAFDIPAQHEVALFGPDDESLQHTNAHIKK